MSIPQIILLAWLALDALALVLLIGLERKPVTPGVAVANLILVAILAWLVVIA